MAAQHLPRTKIEHIPQLMRRSYDRIARSYDRGKGKAAWEERVLDRLKRVLPPNGKVLDLGCGAGMVLKGFRDRGFKVAGIDQSPEMVKYTRRRNPGAQVVARDMRTPGFPSKSFDGIVSTYAIIHVPQAYQPLVFKQMHRLLKPGGFFLINVCAGATEYIGEWNGEWMYWSGASVPETLRRLRACGFKLLWHQGLGPKHDHQMWILGQKAIRPATSKAGGA